MKCDDGRRPFRSMRVPLHGAANRFNPIHQLVDRYSTQQVWLRLWMVNPSTGTRTPGPPASFDPSLVFRAKTRFETRNDVVSTSRRHLRQLLRSLVAPFPRPTAAFAPTPHNAPFDDALTSCCRSHTLVVAMGGICAVVGGGPANRSIANDQSLIIIRDCSSPP